MRTKRVCMLLPPGPEQSWLIMILRRDCALAGQAQTRSASASTRKCWIFPPKITFLLSLLSPPPFFRSVDSRGLKMRILGSADFKGVTGTTLLNTHSTWLRESVRKRGRKLSAHMTYYNRLVYLCQVKFAWEDVGRGIGEQAPLSGNSSFRYEKIGRPSGSLDRPILN